MIIDSTIDIPAPKNIMTFEFKAKKSKNLFKLMSNFSFDGGVYTVIPTIFAGNNINYFEIFKLIDNQIKNKEEDDYYINIIKLHFFPYEYFRPSVIRNHQKSSEIYFILIFILFIFP